ncbi:MAG: hypothetical protein FWG85_02230 [Bacteroidetes bacterium]|nr:hypothetical protein [Bacteroidota bacterium]
MSLKVFKFGGALLNDITGFEQIKKIIDLYSNSDEKNNFIVVISAFGKTTSQLLKMAMEAENNSEEVAISLLNNIIQYHIDIVDKLIYSETKNAECKNYINDQNFRLVNYVKGVSLTKELSLRTKDLILSIGELLASYIVTRYLSQFYKRTINFEITSVLITDDNYGAAYPEMNITNKNINETLLPIFKHCDIVITQGFIGANVSGEITTMGYESSNLTATIIAGAIKSDEFIIWTDVEGIRQYDPKLISKAKPKLISKINYDTAEYLGYSGLKLIYPDMIKLLREYNMEATYRSGFNPTGEYTIVGKEGNINENSMIINTDNLLIYHKSNIINRFNESCFPPMANLLQYQNNIIFISPDMHLFVSDNNIATYIEEDLLDANLSKIKNIHSLLLINYNYSDFSKVMYGLEETLRKQIIYLFDNVQRKTVNILYQVPQEDIKNNLLAKTLIERLFG